MTLKNCSKGYHPGLRLFGATLRRQLGITLLFTVLMLFICPTLVFTSYLSAPEQELEMISGITAIPILNLIVCVVLGIVLLCYNNTHLFSKTSADLYYSLPVRRNTLLLIRFGASAVGVLFAFTVPFIGLAVINFLPRVIGINLGELLLLYAACVFMLLLCLSAVLIFVVNAGSVFHFIFSTFVVCIGVPLLCTCVADCYSIAAEGVLTGGDWVICTSPFSYAIYVLWEGFDAFLIMRHSEYFAQKGTSVEFTSVSPFLIFTLCFFVIPLFFTAIFLAIAFFMNRRRKAERTGDSFAFPAVYGLIVTMAACVGGYVFGSLFFYEYDGQDMNYWIAFAFGAGLVAVGVGAIVAKGFRKFWRWLICAAVAIALMLPAFTIAERMGTAEARNVPSVDEIKSITIEANIDTPTVTLTKDFEMVISLHKYLIENADKTDYIYRAEEYFAPETTENVLVSTTTVEDKPAEEERSYAVQLLGASYCSITYELKDGSSLCREYYIRGVEAKLLYLDIVRTDDFAAAWAEELRATEGITQVSAGVVEFNSDIIFESEETCLLLEAYGRDLQKIENDFSVPYQEYATIELDGRSADGEYPYYKSLYVFESFEETIALLEKLMK